MAQKDTENVRALPVDRLDGYRPEKPKPRIDNLDGFRNELTGIGDPNRDKTFAGNTTGPDFVVRYLSGGECEDRWRGSDLGGRIVETIPAEMTREGWELTVQPDSDEDLSEEEPAGGKLDELDPNADPFALAAPEPKHVPGKLPEMSDEGVEIVEAVGKQLEELDAENTIREALEYEIAYGGGAILLGVDDGQQDLSRPLDWNNVRSLRHITAYRGGWDGELIAWSWYRDPRKANFGKPEVYQLRNLGVPISSPPPPGSTAPQEAYTIPPAATVASGPLVFYVHESRLLIFPGKAVSRRARVQMRGWGDPVFTRVDKVLSDYDQTWGGLANLMQDWAQGVLSLDGLAEMLAADAGESATGTGQGFVAKRALAINMSRSLARVMLLDSNEKFQREVVPLSGVADVLEQFSLRLAAACGMPLSMLMGQVKGGLGDAGNTDLRFFYDGVANRQRTRLLPQVKKLLRVLFAAKKGPTGGVEPKRWTVVMRPLTQLTEQEQTELENKQADTDTKYINAGVVTPEEIAASRFGGSKWSRRTVLDLEGRALMSAPPKLPPAPPTGAAPAKPAVPGAPPKSEPVGSPPPPAPKAQEQQPGTSPSKPEPPTAS